MSALHAIGQAEIESVGRSLEAVASRHSALTYPVVFEIEENSEVNAYATAFKESGRWRGRVVVYRGLIDLIGSDKRLLAAVLAHEVAHLSHGHIFKLKAEPNGEDLSHLYDRAQESEADRSGAILLQRTGRSSKDMVDLLAKMDQDGRGEGYFYERLTGGHPSSLSRASAVADDPRVWQSLLSFDIGLAFMESRRWNLAMTAFHEAFQKEPRLTEASVNASQAALLLYWDLLPMDVKNSWLRPDFGPFLTQPSIAARGDKVTEADRKRHRDALAMLDAARGKGHDPRVRELIGIARVLDPDGTTAIIQQGIADLEGLMTAAEGRRKISLANNVCVGYQRIGALSKGYPLLLEAVTSSTSTAATALTYIPAAIENIGIVVDSGRPAPQDIRVSVLLELWLKSNPAVAPAWRTVRQTYEETCERLKVEPVATEPAPVLLCRPVSLHIGTEEYALFQPALTYESRLGKPDSALAISTKYPDLKELRWKGGDIAVLVEQGRAMRVTSRLAGSMMLLRFEEESNSTQFMVSIGMTKAELGKIFNLAAGRTKSLSIGLAQEEWLYFEGVGVGFAFENDKVSAITVAPTG